MQNLTCNARMFVNKCTWLEHNIKEEEHKGMKKDKLPAMHTCYERVNEAHCFPRSNSVVELLGLVVDKCIRYIQY